MFGFRPKVNASRIGIGLHRRGVCGALVTSSASGPVLERVHLVSTDDTDDQGASIRALIQELDARDAPTHAVLKPGDYNLLQVESPEVPEEELSEAVRWRIKDMIDFHIDDAVVDLFKLPPSSRPGAPKMMYVVAAKSSVVQRCIHEIEDAGANLQAVDITELALRNLQALREGAERPVAVLYLGEDFGVMEIGHERNLYLSRQLTLADDLLERDGAGRHPALEALVLELQRSLDYFESQYAQGSADLLSIVSDLVEVREVLVGIAGEYLTVPVRASDVTQGLTLGPDVDPGTVGSCLPAIGGALRGLV